MLLSDAQNGWVKRSWPCCIVNKTQLLTNQNRGMELTVFYLYIYIYIILFLFFFFYKCNPYNFKMFIFLLFIIFNYYINIYIILLIIFIFGGSEMWAVFVRFTLTYIYNSTLFAANALNATNANYSPKTIYAAKRCS